LFKDSTYWWVGVDDLSDVTDADVDVSVGGQIKDENAYL